MFTILEREVVPSFYNRNDNGIPISWVARVRESMAQLTPRFSADRTVREYTEQYYLSAAAAYGKRVAEQGTIGVQVWRWQRTLAQRWSEIHFGDLHVTAGNGHHLFHLNIYLGELAPEAVKVELYADAVNGMDSVRQEMRCDRHLVGALHGYVYTAGPHFTPGYGLHSARGSVPP